MEHRAWNMEFQHAAGSRILVQGARYKVQGRGKNKKGMMPCTLNPGYWLLTTEFFPFIACC
jgi:hypothetical protein